jgi:hypothetical protein
MQVLVTFLALAINILHFAGVFKSCEEYREESISSTGERARVLFKVYFQNARWQVYLALEISIVLVGLVHLFINVNRGRRYWVLMYAGLTICFVSPFILWETLSVGMHDGYQLSRVWHLYMTLLFLGLVLYSLGIAFLEGPLFEKVSKRTSYLVKFGFLIACWLGELHFPALVLSDSPLVATLLVASGMMVTIVSFSILNVAECLNDDARIDQDNCEQIPFIKP